MAPSIHPAAAPSWVRPLLLIIVVALPVLAILIPILSILVTMPVYFHVLCLINLGIWCWASNVHILAFAGIDVAWLFQEPWNEHRSSGSRDKTQSSSGSRLTSSSSSITGLSIAIPSADSMSQSSGSSSSGLSAAFGVGGGGSSNGGSTWQPVQRRPLHISTKNLYLIASWHLALTVLSIVCFSAVVGRFGEEASEIVPGIAYVLSVGVLFFPLDWWFGAERKQFLRTMKRIAFEGLQSRVFFCDVILADILTSFSRVVGDLHIVFTDLLYNDPSHGSRPRRRDASLPDGPVPATTWQDMIGPFLICLPFLFRLRQCMAEYTQTNDPPAKMRHLLNALKYMSAVPVIASSWLVNWLRVRYQGFLVHDDASGLVNIRETVGGVTVAGAEFRLNFAIGIWVLFSVINSVYSLYWDVYMDWNLGTLRARRSSSSSQSQQSSIARLISSITASTLYQPVATSSTSATTTIPGTASAAMPSSHFFLRQHLHFRVPLLYHIAIAVDLLLRMSWIVKVTLLKTLIKHTLKGDETYEGGAHTLAILLGVDFALKVLEVGRRWMWVFFRCEREWVVRRGYVREGREVGVGGGGNGGGGGVVEMGTVKAT